jgi:hypothetical protein
MMIFLKKDGLLALGQNQIGVQKLPDFTICKHPTKVLYIRAMFCAIINSMCDSSKGECRIENERSIMNKGYIFETGLIGR